MWRCEETFVQARVVSPNNDMQRLMKQTRKNIHRFVCYWILVCLAVFIRFVLYLAHSRYTGYWAGFRFFFNGRYAHANAGPRNPAYKTLNWYFGCCKKARNKWRVAYGILNDNLATTSCAVWMDGWHEIWIGSVRDIWNTSQLLHRCKSDLHLHRVWMERFVSIWNVLTW